MSPPPTSAGKQNRWSDQRIELLLSRMLRVGLTMSVSIAALGGMLLLFRHGWETPHYAKFTGEPNDLKGLSGVLRDCSTGQARGIIQLGLLLLILTPVARVAFAAFGFALQRDSLYVMICSIVFGLLVLSLCGLVP